MNAQLRIITSNGKERVYDPIRKKYVALTPEEWVRQHFLLHIIQVKKYPVSLISVEKKISINGVAKRFDILIFKNSTPWMIVECKSEQTEISENTLRQILAYHSHLQATYLTVTNGQSIHCFDIQNNCWRDSLPFF
ncbi:MAG: type I restriction enzyme HsdR N-terminal domain-containing protein [Bacteroidetes bacterium]|nr:type I restriction enzyme HsdR N-terminal domain-containing protein [Bacteroidota bacterium]